jgi:hypothetical protein
LPYTTLVPGNTITSSWANTNVRDQVVSPFASASARTSAITSPVEGMVSYLADSDTLWYYSGSAWIPIGALPNPVGASQAATSAGSDTTTSDTYVNLAGTGAVTSVSFTKLVSTTRIRVALAGTFFTSAATTGAMFGVNIGGTDYDVIRHSHNTAGTSIRLPFSGFAFVAAGVAAGNYTVQGRWRRTAGAGTLTRDNNDWLSIEAMEVQA